MKRTAPKAFGCYFRVKGETGKLSKAHNKECSSVDFKSGCMAIVAGDLGWLEAVPSFAESVVSQALSNLLHWGSCAQQLSAKEKG